MMVEIWVIYVVIVFVLMSMSGLSQFLMFFNSGIYGFWKVLFIVVGDLSVNMLQMLVVGFGLVVVIVVLVIVFLVIKWVGVVYLIWLGMWMILKVKVNDFNV